MDPGEPVQPDWRAAADYAALLGAERSIFAWEWLRRDPAYRRTALTALAGAASGCAAKPEDWGLCAFEDPDLPAPRARPIWTRAAWPEVLEADAEREAPDADRLDLARFAGLVALAKAAAGPEHLLLSDGLRALRLDVVSGSLVGSPVGLRYRLAGLASAERPLETLRRLLALHRLGRFAGTLHPPEARAGRWILMLRAHDALAGGAAQREIASVLLSGSAGEPRWRSESPSLRSRAQRLARAARRMASGEWKMLLR